MTMNYFIAFALALAGAASCAIGTAQLAIAHSVPAGAQHPLAAGVFLLMVGLASYIPAAIRLIRVGIDDY